MNNKVTMVLVLASLAVLGAAAGGYWFGTRSSNTDSNGDAPTSQEAGRPNLFFIATR